jgi:hypothetical protein
LSTTTTFLDLTSLSRELFQSCATTRKFVSLVGMEIQKEDLFHPK